MNSKILVFILLMVDCNGSEQTSHEKPIVMSVVLKAIHKTLKIIRTDVANINQEIKNIKNEMQAQAKRTRTMENAIVINQIVLKSLKDRVRENKEKMTQRVTAMENVAAVNYMFMSNMTNDVKQAVANQNRFLININENVRYMKNIQMYNITEDIRTSLQHQNAVDFNLAETRHVVKKSHRVVKKLVDDVISLKHNQNNMEKNITENIRIKHRGTRKTIVENQMKMEQNISEAIAVASRNIQENQLSLNIDLTRALNSTRKSLSNAIVNSTDNAIRNLTSAIQTENRIVLQNLSNVVLDTQLNLTDSFINGNIDLRTNITNLVNTTEYNLFNRMDTDLQEITTLVTKTHSNAINYLTSNLINVKQLQVNLTSNLTSLVKETKDRLEYRITEVVKTAELSMLKNMTFHVMNMNQNMSDQFSEVSDHQFQMMRGIDSMMLKNIEIVKETNHDVFKNLSSIIANVSNMTQMMADDVNEVKEDQKTLFKNISHVVERKNLALLKQISDDLTVIKESQLVMRANLSQGMLLHNTSFPKNISDDILMLLKGIDELLIQHLAGYVLQTKSCLEEILRTTAATRGTTRNITKGMLQVKRLLTVLPGKTQSSPAPSCQWLDQHVYNLNNGYYWIQQRGGEGGGGGAGGAGEREMTYCDMTNGGIVPGSIENPASSCKSLHEQYPELRSGLYWINTHNITTRMYCEMQSGQGGWTLVGQAVVETDATATEVHYQKLLSDDLKQLHRVQKNFLLGTKGLNTLHKYISFKQIRFQCHKPYHGRTIDLYTLNNDMGAKVVQRMLGLTDTQPPSCKTFARFPDDSSLLGSRCEDWYEKKWWGCSSNGRMYCYPLYITPKHYFHLGFERTQVLCDDDQSEEGYSPVGRWRVYVR